MPKIHKKPQLKINLDEYFKNKEYSLSINKKLQSGNVDFPLQQTIITTCKNKLSKLQKKINIQKKLSKSYNHSDSDIDDVGNIIHNCATLLYYGKISPSKINQFKYNGHEIDSDDLLFESNHGQFNIRKWNDNSWSISNHQLNSDVGGEYDLDIIIQDNLNQLNYIQSEVFPKKQKK